LNSYTPLISSRTPLCFEISCLRRVSYQRSCQTHNTNETASSHSIVTSPPFTALHSTTHPTICLPRPSILHAGRHPRSCCLTLVSNCSCPRVLRAGQLGQEPLQPAFPASFMHVASLYRSGQRAFGSLQTAELLLTLFRCCGPAVTPDLRSHHGSPSHLRVSPMSSARYVTQNHADHTIFLP